MLSFKIWDCNLSTFLYLQEMRKTLLHFMLRRYQFSYSRLLLASTSSVTPAGHARAPNSTRASGNTTQTAGTKRATTWVSWYTSRRWRVKTTCHPPSKTSPSSSQNRTSTSWKRTGFRWEDPFFERSGSNWFDFSLQENLKGLKALAGSKIVFFKNGESLGEAFTDIFEGDYTPAVSAYPRFWKQSVSLGKLVSLGDVHYFVDYGQFWFLLWRIMLLQFP